MSYSLYIVRSRSVEAGDKGIAKSEWFSAVSQDEDCAFIADEGDVMVSTFELAGRHELMSWQDGMIQIDMPSAEMIDKIDELAQLLDAKVLGRRGWSETELKELKKSA